MTKIFLMVGTIGLLGMGLIASPAMAEDEHHVTPVGEVQLDQTVETSTEAEAEFEADVDCNEQSVDGATTEDCVSTGSGETTHETTIHEEHVVDEYIETQDSE